VSLHPCVSFDLPSWHLSSKKEANSHTRVGSCGDVVSFPQLFPLGFFFPFFIVHLICLASCFTLHLALCIIATISLQCILTLHSLQSLASVFILLVPYLLSLSHWDVFLPANNTYISFLTRTCSINIFPVFSRLFRLSFRFFFLTLSLHF